MFMGSHLLDVFSFYVLRCFEELPKFTHCATLGQIIPLDEFQPQVNNNLSANMIHSFWLDAESLCVLLPGWGQKFLSFLKRRNSE